MRICVIGGGTGSSAVLNGLKEHEDLQLSVVVGMADDGGSNAIIRDEFGLLPLSDVRKSIIALSTLENNDILRDLFTYRFSEGNGLAGHTLGNLIMTALSKIENSEKEAVRDMSEIFQVKGKVLPVTFENYRLAARFDDGTVVHSEHLIDEPDISEAAKITEFWSEPVAKADQEALDSIIESDFVVIGPGDVYTTILATLIPAGVFEALQKTEGKIVYITNLMSKIGQTRHQTQSQILELLERYIGRRFDRIITSTETIPRHILRYYHQSGEHYLKDDLGEDPRVVRSELVAEEIFQNDKGDRLVRSIVRHDTAALGQLLYKIFNQAILE